MRIMNWEAVEETSFAKPPVGGCVAVITDVEDVPAREYLNVVYDIAEGDWAGFYSDDFGRENPWAHRFVRSYKESARGMFKAFLKRLEESNPGFTVASWRQRSDERELVGLLIGIVLQYEDYTNDRGEDGERLQVVAVHSAPDIRAGSYRVSERKDSRRQLPAAATAAIARAAATPPAPADPSAWQLQAAFGEQPPISAYGDLPF